MLLCSETYNSTPLSTSCLRTKLGTSLPTQVLMEDPGLTWVAFSHSLRSIGKTLDLSPVWTTELSTRHRSAVVQAS